MGWEDDYKQATASSTPTDQSFTQGPLHWKQQVGEVASSVLPTLGLVAGGSLGTALGTPTGPLGMAVGGATFAGAGQYAGEQAAKGVNALLGLGLTPEQSRRGLRDAMLEGATMEVGGQLLGRAGSALLSKFPRAVTPQKLAPMLAGEAIAQSRVYTPLEEAMLGPGQLQMERALARTPEIGNLPRSVITGSPRDVALERLSIPRVGGVMDAQRQQARQAITKRVDTAIPSVPKSAEIVRGKIEAYNAEATAAAEARANEINAARQEAVKRINAQRELNARKAATKQPSLSAQQLQEAEAQYAAEFKQKYGESLNPAEDIKTPTQQIGQNIYDSASKAEEVSKARFSSEETGYNQPKFVNAEPAPPENSLSVYVAENKPPIGFSAYADPESKLAGLLRAEELGGREVELPSMDYRTLREISEAAGKAQRRAALNPEARNTAVYFGNLKAAAESTITDMLGASGGRAVADEYQALNKLFATQHVPAFRQGTLGNTILRAGKEAGGLRTEAGDIPKLFKNAGNIDDLMRGFGTEAAASRAGAEAMQPLTENEILMLGREKTADALRPFYIDELAAAYKTGGRKSVNSWVIKNEPILRKLGIYNEFSPWLDKSANIEKLKKFLPTAEKIPYEVQKAAKFNVVKDTLGLKDPLDAYNYLANADNPKQAVQQLLSVSRDPRYRQAIQELVRDGLKADMQGAGINIFNPAQASTPANVAKSQHLRDVLPYLYDKKQIRTLKDYHTIMSRLDNTVSSEGLRAQLGENAAAKLESIVATIPMGYKGYWAKHGLLTAIGFIEKRYENAAVELLDRAMTDPKYADALVKAFRDGNTKPVQSLVTGIDKEQRALRASIKALGVEKIGGFQQYGEDMPVEPTQDDVRSRFGLTEEEYRRAFEAAAAQRK